MKHARRPDPALLLRVQVLVAAVLPWLVSKVIAPGLLTWSLAVVALTIVFALLRRSDPRVWLLPVNAVTCAVPTVPDIIAAGTSIAVGIYLLIDPPREQVTWSHRVRWLVIASLAVVAAVIGVNGIVTERSSNATFTVAQQQAEEAWDAPLVSNASGDEFTGAAAVGDGPAEEQAQGATEVENGPPIARMYFTRPGSTQAPVTSSTLFIGDGVDESNLTRGPGHYPFTSDPGMEGNFAVAGHRTGWGAPFAALDQLREGDIVSVEDREGRRFDYEIQRSEVVDPSADWVLDPDPLGSGRPTLTLTTCDPPGINTKRLIVWGTLVGSAVT